MINTEYDIAYYKAYSNVLKNRLNNCMQAKKNANKRLKEFKYKLKNSKNIRVNACVRKEVYRTQAEAQCICQIQQEKLKPYKCDFCNGWHVCTK